MESEGKKWCYTCKACQTNIKNRLVIPLTILKPLKRCLPQRPVGYISFYLENDKWIKILLFALDNNMLHHMPGLYIYVCWIVIKTFCLKSIKILLVEQILLLFTLFNQKMEILFYFCSARRSISKIGLAMCKWFLDIYKWSTLTLLGSLILSTIF